MATTADPKQDRIGGIASEQGLNQGRSVKENLTEDENTPARASLGGMLTRTIGVTFRKIPRPGRA